MKIATDIAPGGRDLALVMTTEHDGYSVVSAVHQQVHPRRQGGVRFVRSGSLEELAHLAHGMTEKAAAAGVAIDGMKAMVICPAGVPDDPARRAGMLAAHIRQAIEVDARMVFGPDMGCPENVLDLVATHHELAANVTGLSRAYGGLDIDRNGLTAHGVVAAIETAVPLLEGARIAIQGFGAVGAPTALYLHRAGARVVGISNVAGLLHADDGIDIPALWPLWQAHGDGAFERFAGSTGCAFDPEPQGLLSLPADVFVPAARTSVLGMAADLPALRGENPDVVAIEEFVAGTGVKVIAEAANHPLSFPAEAYAEAQGVVVLPDIIVNCGGMIGCSYEYDHRPRLLAEAGGYDAALRECRARIRETVRVNLDGRRGGRLSAADLRRRAMRREGEPWRNPGR